MLATELIKELQEIVNANGDLPIYQLVGGSFFEPNITNANVYLRGCENEPYWTNSPEEDTPEIGEKFLWI